MLIYLYVYVGCPKFSPSTTDILTNITCYIVKKKKMTLIKDSTLSVQTGHFILTALNLCLTCKVSTLSFPLAVIFHMSWTIISPYHDFPKN